MDIEKIKRILESYTLDKQYYNDLMLDIEELQNKYSRLSTKFGSIDILKAQINRLSNLSDATLKNIEKVESVINSLNQPSKDILYYKYIKSIQNHKIALRLNYSVPRIYQLTNIALKEFAIEYLEQEKAPKQKDYSKL